MKKYFLLFVFFSFLFSHSLYSQVSVDPNDDFYEDVTGWYIKGLVERLPQVKPYTLVQVREILSQVMECEDEKEAKRANDYWVSHFKFPVHLKAEGDFGLNFALSEDPDSSEALYEDAFELYSAKGTLTSDFMLGPYVGLGMNVSFRGTNNDDSISCQFPRFVNNSEYSKMEGLSFSDGDIDYIFEPAANISFGKGFFNASLGYSRLGYGIFTDSDLILNPRSNPMPNAVLDFVSNYLEYTHVQAFASASSISEEDDYRWGKVFAFHSFRVPLFNRKFLISYYESVVYGEGFNASYLMPVPWAVIANAAGFNENLLAGINLQFKPVDCFVWSTDFLFDDIDEIKDFVKLKWNDAVVRAAIKTGIVYTPTSSPCRMIKFDYTLVTPYTYSYYDTRDSSYNYAEYSNNGICIGSDLIPNSHQFAVDIKFNPVSRFYITSSSKFILHANPLENLSVSDIYSAYEAAKNSGLSQAQLAYALYNDGTNFMNQEHKMAVVRSGIDLSYEFAAKTMSSFKFFAGYTFEYIMNDGVDAEIYPSSYVRTEQKRADILKAYFSHDTDSLTKYMRLQNPLEFAKKDWIDNLSNTYHHYFTAGVVLKL